MNTCRSERGAPAARRGSLWALLALAAAGAAGCGLPPSRVDFIEGLAKENRDIARSTRGFRAALQPLQGGQPANAAQVRSAYNDMEAAVQKAKADMNLQLLPPSSNSAKAFLDAYRTYLNGQQDILQNQMLPIVQEVEKPTQDSPAAQYTTVIKPLLDQVTAKENETWGSLVQAQNAYCGEHNYMAMDVNAFLAAQKSGK